MKVAAIFNKFPKSCKQCKLRVSISFNKLEEEYCILGGQDEYDTKFPSQLDYIAYFEDERPSWCKLVELDSKIGISK